MFLRQYPQLYFYPKALQSSGRVYKKVLRHIFLFLAPGVDAKSRLQRVGYVQESLAQFGYICSPNIF